MPKVNYCYTINFFLITFAFLIVLRIISLKYDTSFDLKKSYLKLNQYLYVDQITSSKSTYIETTIFCIILTNPNNFYNRAITINNTWAAECDNYRFISIIPEIFLNPNKTYEKTIEIDYPFKLLQPADHKQENYQKLTEKVFRAFIDIHKRYSNYEWYLKADDDTFVIVENLRSFLAKKQSSLPLTYGYNLKYFRSGGAGYVISKKAFNLMGSSLSNDKSFCQNSGAEDVDVAGCLNKLNVVVGNSSDEMGRERFHPFNVTFHWYGDYFAWVKELAVNPVQKGEMAFSNESISFHYMTIEQQNRMSVLWNIYKKLRKTNNSLNFHNFILKNNINF